MKRLISIILPCFNEAENIKEIYRRLISVFEEIAYDYEMIFVNDGSTDDTEKEVLDLVENDKDVKLISFTRNFGHQYALFAGYNNCSGDAAITMDCDLQHPPELIKDLIKHWENGYEIVSTKRVDTMQKNIFKRYTSKYFYRFFSYLSGIPIEEGQADYRLTAKVVVERINALTERNLFLRGMFYWFGYRSISIEYLPNERFAGITKYSFKRMIKLALDGITSFSIIPLRMVTIFGFSISGVAFLYIIYVLYTAIFTENTVPGWASVILGVVLLGGVQLIAIGILGEYVGRVFMEMKERPRYIIKSKRGW